MRALIQLNNREQREKVDSLLLAKKTKQKKKQEKNKSQTLLDKIHLLQSEIDRLYDKSKVALITKVEDLEYYISKANQNGIVAIDTETTGLNPITDIIVGVSLYTPGEKAVYIPINHKDIYTLERIEKNQLTPKDVKHCMDELNAKVILHNASFDTRFLQNSCNVNITTYWETYIASRVLNENDDTRGKLKEMYRKYVDQSSRGSFKDATQGIRYDLIPIHLAYVYAANDALMTYELYEFQKQFLSPHQARQDLVDLYNLYMDIEVPLVQVGINMENRGVSVDFEKLEELEEKYNKIREEASKKCYDEIDKFRDEIDFYKAMNPGHKLSDPILLTSPAQLQILLYDIMKIPDTFSGGTKGTGESILEQMNTEFTRALIEFRKVQKLISTYLTGMRQYIYDGKVHPTLNTYGADTGRLSTKEPNIQSIPARNSEIRLIFTAGTERKQYDKSNVYEITKEEEVLLQDGSWVWSELVKVGDVLDGGEEVKSVEIRDKITITV